MYGSLMKKVQVGFGAALLILTFISVTSYRAVGDSIAAARWVSQTRETMVMLAALGSDLLDAESTVRGYVISGDQKFLQHYEVLRRRIWLDLFHLRQMMAGSQPLQRQLDELEALITSRLRLLEGSVHLVKVEGPGHPDLVVQADKGREVMEQARNLIAVLQAVEDDSLTRGTDRAATTARRAKGIIVVVNALAIGLAAVAMLSIRREVAARMRSEHEIRELNMSLEQRVRDRSAELEGFRAALERKAQELARSNADLEQFAYVASHDLQEPLRTVASFAQLLQKRYRGKLDASADDFIHYIVDGATRMQGLIIDLLAYSRVGRSGKEFVPTNCTAVFDQAVTNLQVAVAECGAVVTHDPLPTVQTDGTQLVQLFQNLIGNSIKFRDTQTPRVHVAAERKASEWVFSVKDNGKGIDPQYAGRIFEVFQRLHTRTEYPGSGIGLSISKKIVERHGGRIWVESQLNQGATFFFTLPA